MADGTYENYLGGTDADVWVNGLELAPWIQSLSDAETFNNRQSRGLGQTGNRTVYSGAFNSEVGLSGLYWINDAVKAVKRMISLQDYGTGLDAATFLIAYDELLEGKPPRSYVRAHGKDPRLCKKAKSRTSISRSNCKDFAQMEQYRQNI